MISWLDGEGEARREHEIIAARQIFHVAAVLIHQRKPLDAAFLRTGFVDEHDAAVEIALLAGKPLVDRVRDHVRDAAPVVGRGLIALAVEMAAGEHVPQVEVGAQAAVRQAREPAGDERLGVDRAPVGKARRVGEIGDALIWRPGRSARRGRCAGGSTR